MLRYFSVAPAPFQYLLAPDGGLAAALPSGSPPAAQLARSTLRGLQLLPVLRWPLAAALPALLQHHEADVRWCAAEAAALTFGLHDGARTQVRLLHGAVASSAGQEQREGRSGKREVSRGTALLRRPCVRRLAAP